jgi:hypothetical protein
MKRLLTGVCIFFFSLSLAYSQIASQQVSGFKFPEDVVKYFVQSIKNGNFDDAIKTSAFYYDRIIDKINAKEMALRLKSIHPLTPFNAPTQYHSFIKLRALSDHALDIQMFISSLLLPEQFEVFLTNAERIVLSDNEQLLDSYLSSLEDIQRLGSLEFIRMDISSPDLQSGNVYKQIIKEREKVYDFDEEVAYTVLYKWNGKYYAGGFTFMKYGISWYVKDYFSSLSGLSSLCTLEPISGIEEYTREYVNN